MQFKTMFAQKGARGAWFFFAVFQSAHGFGAVQPIARPPGLPYWRVSGGALPHSIVPLPPGSAVAQPAHAARTPRVAGRPPPPSLRAGGWQGMETKLVQLLSSTSSDDAVGMPTAASARVSKVSLGEFEVPALLDGLEAANPPPSTLDKRKLVGKWQLEYSNNLPAAVTQAIAHTADDTLDDLSVQLTIDGEGAMSTECFMSFHTGKKTDVLVPSRLVQLERSPIFMVAGEQDEEVALEVTYLSDDVLIIRTHLEFDDELNSMLTKAAPRTDVWVRIHQAARAREPTAAGASSLWRFGLSHVLAGKRGAMSSGNAEVSQSAGDSHADREIFVRGWKNGPDVAITSATFFACAGAAALLAPLFLFRRWAARQGASADKARLSEQNIADEKPSAVQLTTMFATRSATSGTSSGQDATESNGDDGSVGRGSVLRHLPFLNLLRSEPGRAADAQVAPDEMARMREYMINVEQALNILVDMVPGALESPASVDTESSTGLWASDFELDLTKLDESAFRFLEAVATIPSDRQIKGLTENLKMLNELQSFRENLVLQCRIVLEPKTRVAVAKDLASERVVSLRWSVEFDMKPFQFDLPEWSSPKTQDYIKVSVQAEHLGSPVTLCFQGFANFHFNRDGRISRLDVVDTDMMYKAAPDIPQMAMTDTVFQVAARREPFVYA